MCSNEISFLARTLSQKVNWIVLLKCPSHDSSRQQKKNLDDDERAQPQSSGKSLTYNDTNKFFGATCFQPPLLLNCFCVNGCEFCNGNNKLFLLPLWLPNKTVRSQCNQLIQQNKSHSQQERAQQERKKQNERKWIQFWTWFCCFLIVFCVQEREVSGLLLLLIVWWCSCSTFLLSGKKRAKKLIVACSFCYKK